MFNLKKKGGNKDESKNIALDQKIEALLFFKGDEISLKFLMNNLSEKKGKIKQAIEDLRKRLDKSALTLVENNNTYLLTTGSEYSNIIKSLIKEEETSELSKPALEALSIILYRSPISKASLDEIRGINSSYILRNLLIRGLIEKEKRDGRNLYRPTMDLLRFIGIENKSKLPEYDRVIENIRNIEEGNIQN